MSTDRNRYSGSNHYARSNHRRRRASKTSGKRWKAIDKGVGMTANAIWHSSDAYQMLYGENWWAYLKRCLLVLGLRLVLTVFMCAIWIPFCIWLLIQLLSH